MRYNTDQQGGLDDKEFVYMMINLVSDYPLDLECTNCLQKTRVELASFFDYVDCSGDQEVSPQEMIHAFKNMDLKGTEVKCEHVNEFFRQADKGRQVQKIIYLRAH